MSKITYLDKVLSTSELLEKLKRLTPYKAPNRKPPITIKLNRTSNILIFLAFFFFAILISLAIWKFTGKPTSEGVEYIAKVAGLTSIFLAVASLLFTLCSAVMEIINYKEWALKEDLERAEIDFLNTGEIRIHEALELNKASKYLDYRVKKLERRTHILITLLLLPAIAAVWGVFKAPVDTSSISSFWDKNPTLAVAAVLIISALTVIYFIMKEAQSYRYHLYLLELALLEKSNRH